jgi:hypothetical protein
MESLPGCGTAAEGARTQAVIPPAPTERQYALRRRRGSYGVESTNNIRAFPGRVAHEQINKRGTYWDFPKTISERFSPALPN